MPQVEDVAGQVTAWEEQNQEDLGVLAALIWKIREVVRERGGRAVLRYDAGRDGLVFGEMEGRGLLPGDLYGRWDGGEREERNG